MILAWNFFRHRSSTRPTRHTWRLLVTARDIVVAQNEDRNGGRPLRRFGVSLAVEVKDSEALLMLPSSHGALEVRAILETSEARLSSTRTRRLFLG